MGTTTIKGEIGEAMIIADLRKRGFGVLLPFGHDTPFDLVLYRKETGSLERVQVKYTESDGNVVKIKCRSASDWVQYRYTAKDVDWIAAYDPTTDCCYYVPLICIRRYVRCESPLGSDGQWPNEADLLGVGSPAS